MSSPVTRVVGGTLIAAAVVGMLSTILETKPPPTPSPPAAPYIAKLLATRVIAWRVAVPERRFVADIAITNPTPQGVGNLRITCDVFGATGSRLDGWTITWPGVATPTATTTIRGAAFGSTPQFATTAACRVSVAECLPPPAKVTNVTFSC